jgi:hypothetical protein
MTRHAAVDIEEGRPGPTTGGRCAQRWNDSR